MVTWKIVRVSDVSILSNIYIYIERERERERERKRERYYLVINLLLFVMMLF